MNTVESTAMAPDCSSSKKRAAETDACIDSGTEKSQVEPTLQQPCKKQKLSKKDLLEAAKARLREAQEKKKLAEEKKREAESQPEPPPPQEQQGFDEYGYEDDFYYEYHIPPVTGPRESLLIQNVAATGPAEKVTFIDDNKDCIEQILKVINERKRENLSPVNLGPPWTHQAANPQGPPPGPFPPRQDPIKSSSSAGSAHSNNHKSFPPPRHNQRNGSNNSTDHSMHSSPNQPQRPHLYPPPPNQMNQPNRPSNGREREWDGDRERDGRENRKRDRDGGERMNNNIDRERPRDRDSIGSDRNRRDPQSSKDRPPPRELQAQPPLQQQRREGATPNQQRRESAPPTSQQAPSTKQQPQQQQQQQQQRKDSPAPPSSNTQRRESAAQPNKPQTRPWKLALAQITGKTLDCSVELPTKSSYLIRTQTQGVLAHIQFFTVPDNPALLQHKPSKRHLQDHLTPVANLPCNNNQCWKAQDILAFLQHQDERRTTYQPPARRNLPLSHWAILDLEQPLHQTADSLGYFTAQRQSPGNNNDKNNNGKKEISFAGKLVWNMNDFYQNQDSGMRQRNASKLSKWGEVVSAKATTGVRNSPLIAIIQGFYDVPATGSKPSSMPPALRARKVILPKSRTIGMIIGVNHKLVEAATEKNGNAAQQQQQQQQQQAQTIMGCVHVLFPNGMASGPSSAHSLRGARAILYD